MSELGFYLEPENNLVRISYAPPTGSMFVGLVSRKQYALFPAIGFELPESEIPAMRLITSCVGETGQLPQVFISRTPMDVTVTAAFQLRLGRRAFLKQVLKHKCQGILCGMPPCGSLGLIHLSFVIDMVCNPDGFQYFCDGFRDQKSFSFSWVKGIPKDGDQVKAFWQVELRSLYNVTVI